MLVIFAVLAVLAALTVVLAAAAGTGHSPGTTGDLPAQPEPHPARQWAVRAFWGALAALPWIMKASWCPEVLTEALEALEVILGFLRVHPWTGWRPGGPGNGPDDPDSPDGPDAPPPPC